MTLEFEEIESHPNFLCGDDKIIVILAVSPIAPGQLQVFPREHFTIMEQTPSDVVKHMFITANKLSTVLFENINCQGTNVIVENGIPAGQSTSRFSINIIPRRENDGLNLLWSPQKFSEDQMATIALRLEEHTKKIVLEQKKQVPVIQEEQNKKIDESREEVNYKLKQLKRIP